MGCKRDSLERALVIICKFWNFDNIFLVGIGFKFLKLKYMLHVFVKILIIKLIRTNKLLSLSTKTYMHVTCFVKTIVVIYTTYMRIPFFE